MKIKMILRSASRHYSGNYEIHKSLKKLILKLKSVLKLLNQNVILCGKNKSQIFSISKRVDILKLKIEENVLITIVVQ